VVRQVSFEFIYLKIVLVCLFSHSIYKTIFPAHVLTDECGIEHQSGKHTNLRCTAQDLTFLEVLLSMVCTSALSVKFAGAQA